MWEIMSVDNPTTNKHEVSRLLTLGWEPFATSAWSITSGLGWGPSTVHERLWLRRTWPVDPPATVQ